MRLHRGLGALALVAMFGIVTGPAALACGDGAKTRGAQATKVSKAGGGSCGMSMTASGAGCGAAKHTVMTAADCEKHLRTYYASHGWLGLEMDCRGLQKTITKVAEGSPAEKAGFRPGDTLASVNGVPYEEGSEAAIQEVVDSKFEVGEKVRFTVLRDGKTVEMKAKLVRIPEKALEEMVASHLADQHGVDKAENLR